MIEGTVSHTSNMLVSIRDAVISAAGTSVKAIDVGASSNIVIKGQNVIWRNGNGITSSQNIVTCANESLYLETYSRINEYKINNVTVNGTQSVTQTTKSNLSGVTPTTFTVAKTTTPKPHELYFWGDNEWTKVVSGVENTQQSIEANGSYAINLTSAYYYQQHILVISKSDGEATMGILAPVNVTKYIWTELGTHTAYTVTAGKTAVTITNTAADSIALRFTLIPIKRSTQ